MRVRPYCRCPFGKLISFFPRRHIVTMIHSYDQAATFSPPVDCFVSFQGPFVFTDSALTFPAISQPIKTVIRVPRLQMPRRCTFSADAAVDRICLRQTDDRGRLLMFFFELTASPGFHPPPLLCFAPAAGSLQEGSS